MPLICRTTIIHSDCSALIFISVFLPLLHFFPPSLPPFRVLPAPPLPQTQSNPCALFLTSMTHMVQTTSVTVVCACLYSSTKIERYCPPVGDCYFSPMKNTSDVKDLVIQLYTVSRSIIIIHLLLEF